MANELSTAAKIQLFAQESPDPFLTLITLSNETFTARLVNNSVDVVSRGFTYTAFPMKIRLPIDDGESTRDVAIDFDNASLDLITNLRSVSGNIGVTIEMILASMPDTVQMSIEDLLISTITYDATKISARLIMDSFLAIEMTSERYNPNNFPGLF